MKKYLFLMLVFLLIPAQLIAADYALFALQIQTEQVDGDTWNVWKFEKGESTFTVPENRGQVLATSGGWSMVMFLIDQIKPEGWTALQAADWMAQADGFLAFDYRMLGEYARAGTVSITGRTFDYDTVLDVVLRYEWWAEEDGQWVRHTGSKADYVANGYPSKLVRVLPMPHFMGLPNDRY